MPMGVYPRRKYHLEICKKGGLVSPTKFKRGHKVPEEWRELMRKANKGRVLSEDIKRKIGEGHKGLSPWNKGLKGVLTSWNKGLTKEMDERVLKSSLKLKGKPLTKEHIRKCLCRKERSSLELKMEKLINQYNLPYKFVGNGQFFIERKNPDFININGEKIAIEVFYRKHKELFGRGKILGLEGWKNERQEIFNKYGWKIIFLDETQVNDNFIKNNLQIKGD